MDELRRVDAFAGAAGIVQPFLLRVNPGVRVDTHESIATGHESTAFGVPAADACATIAVASSLANVRFLGLHAHIGSQVPTSEPFMRELDVLVALAARLREDHGIAVEMLDMGGGFAITYTDEWTPSIADIAAAAERRLGVPCGELGLPLPTLAAEPGRSIVGNPGISLYRVGDRRTLGDGRTVIAVDGGMSDNIRPMLYDARYTVALASRAGGPVPEMVSIVGRHCESGDVLADAVTLPSDVERGDLLAFAATGAYTYPLASTYNRIGRPAVVAVDEGHASVWVRREGSGDLDRLEAPAPRKAPDADPPEGITIRPAAPERRPVVPVVLEGDRRRGPVRAERGGRTRRRASIARGSVDRGPTGRRRSSPSTATASSGTSTSSASRIPSRGTSRRSGSRCRPIAVDEGSVAC